MPGFSGVFLNINFFSFNQNFFNIVFYSPNQGWLQYILLAILLFRLIERMRVRCLVVNFLLWLTPRFFFKSFY